MKRPLIILAAITFLGFLLRIVMVGEMPVGFHRDEAFLGYNAYSLLLTGKEMTGQFLPLHLTSFLHSPAGYSYAAIPTTVLFGLTPFATRLPSVIFGTLTIPLAFFLALFLFEKVKEKYLLGIVSALLLSISPWHITLSRVATENVLVVFFITLGTLFYLISIKKHSVLFLAASFLLFSFSLLTYQAPRAFLPLLLPILIYAYQSPKQKKLLFLSGICYLLFIILPILIILFSPELSERIRMLSILHHPQTQLVLNEQLREDGVIHIPGILARVFHNKLTSFSWSFLFNYMQHFSFDFLFGDAALPMRYHIPMMGLLYLFEGILLLIGIISLFLKKTKEGILLLAWFFFAPIGSALTFDDVPNMQRTLLIFPSLSIISTIGAYEIWKGMRNKLWYPIGLLLFGIFSIFSLSYFLHQYFIHQKYHQPWFRDEGYQQLVLEVAKREDQYNQVQISKAESDPYIFFLYFGKVPPQTIQQMYKTEGPIYKKQIGTIIFPDKDCPLTYRIEKNQDGMMQKRVLGREGILYVNHGKCEELPRNAKIVQTIRRSDNSIIFTLLEYNK